jgi:predicted TIM-barrel fold metal-dependent hydrolase
LEYSCPPRIPKALLSFVPASDRTLPLDEPSLKPNTQTLSMNRRSFLRNTALAAAAATVGCNRIRASGAPEMAIATGPTIHGCIDCHVYTSRWPFRRLPCDETPKLVNLLRSYGVAKAWTGSFDALLHRDIMAVNIRLVEECSTGGPGLLVPFGAVNPALPDWEEDLRLCHEVHHMPGIRLHPDFHGYSLDDARFRRLMELATNRGLVVQIALGMEDPRTQSPIARLEAAHPGPLVDLLPSLPQAKVVLLNFFRSFGYNRVLLVRLSSLPQISFDMATSDGLDGIRLLLESVPNIRLLFGSFAPFYNFDSSRLKLQESALAESELAAICNNNASAILRLA